MDIKIQNASLSKNEFSVLKDVNLSLQFGKHYAVFGETGSGKTTFLEALAGQIFPRSGQISRPKGMELVPGDYSFHRYIGAAYQYYQQRYHAYDSELGPTLWEVLQNQVKPLGTIDDTSVALDDPLYEEEYLKEICKLFRVDHLLDRKVTTLSTGETRRSLLARSVLKSPNWLLLDNPFSGLDEESRALLKKILASLEEHNIGIILVCSLQDVPDFMADFLWIENGNITALDKKDLAKITENVLGTTVLDDALLDRLAVNDYQDFATAISFRNAKVTYGGKYALKDFTWKVEKGDRWALMGPNGSGKSTILSLINADNPQAYRNELILFDRKRGSGESIWDIKKKIGFVSAELQHYYEKGMAVWELVGSGLFDTAGLYRDLTDKQLQTVFNYLRLIGIQDIAERPVHHLSKGEMRLAFLARALVKNPPVLILDEPCQGLDYHQMVHFRSILDSLVPAFEKTLIYVTHYEDEIPQCVNKRLDISEGQIIRMLE